VPPWIGLGEDSVVLRVPHAGLETTQFNVTPTVRDNAVKAARDDVAAQLSSPVIAARLAALRAGRRPEPGVYQPGVRKIDPATEPDRVTIVGFIAATVVAVLVGLLGWWATNSAGSEGLGRIGLLLAIGIIGVGLGLWYISGRSGLRAAGRARLGITAATRPNRRPAVVAFAAGIACIAIGAGLSVAAMHDRADTTRRGHVIAAAETDGRNIYTVHLAAGDVDIVTKRHLRLGERIFVSTAGGTPHLVGALDDGRFGVAVFTSVLGVGLITSGVKRWRWATRCQALVDLVGGWTDKCAPGVPLSTSPTGSG
jgi:hypothetical protein